MRKKELFRVLNRATREEVLSISGSLEEKYQIMEIKPAQKALAMIKVREPVANSLFYMGELLCCECMVEINGHKGFAVLSGDDFEKVTAAAAIDGALNGELAEVPRIVKHLEALEIKQREDRKPMNAQIMKSKVNFSVMGE